MRGTGAQDWLNSKSQNQKSLGGCSQQGVQNTSLTISISGPEFRAAAVASTMMGFVVVLTYWFPPRSKWANVRVLNLFLLKHWSSSLLPHGKLFLLWRVSAVVLL